MKRSKQRSLALPPPSKNFDFYQAESYAAVFKRATIFLPLVFASRRNFASRRGVMQTSPGMNSCSSCFDSSSGDIALGLLILGS
jgi:hypothetical protein